MGRIKPQALLIQSKKKKAPSHCSLTAIIACILLGFFIVLSLCATYKRWFKSSENVQFKIELKKFEVLKHSEDHGESNNLTSPISAVLNTSKGLITVELYKDASVDVVDKFVELCKKGYFRGMLFNRVIKHRVIQGGDFQRPAAIEGWTSSERSQSKLATSAIHDAFMLGTAKTAGDTEGFELFITTAPIPNLNDKLTVFGRIIEGKEIVQDIEEVDTDEHYKPKAPIGIFDINIKLSY